MQQQREGNLVVVVAEAEVPEDDFETLEAEDDYGTRRGVLVEDLEEVETAAAEVVRCCCCARERSGC